MWISICWQVVLLFWTVGVSTLELLSGSSSDSSLDYYFETFCWFWFVCRFSKGEIGYLLFNIWHIDVTLHFEFNYEIQKKELKQIFCINSEIDYFTKRSSVLKCTIVANRLLLKILLVIRQERMRKGRTKALN